MKIKIMVNSRTKNATRNAVAGVLNRIVGLFIPFLMRTVLIKVLGEEYLGLSSLFSSILQVLNLADLGFSTAIVYNMYEPISKGDDNIICALLNLYKKIYTGIGLIILAVGLCLCPFLDKFISGSYPEELNLTVLYLMYLFNTVISYTCFAHRKSLLSAFQRSDIVDNINSIIQLVLDLIKIVLLILIKSYYIYVIFIPIITLIGSIVTAVVSYKMYPQYKCVGKVDNEIQKSILKRVTGLTIQRFGNTISTSLDSIVISSFLGLSLLAIYSNYFYIVSSLGAFVWVCIASTTAGLGNSIVTQSIEKNYEVFKKLNILNQWTICWCVPCLLCLYQHFMRIWVGEGLMAGMDLVLCMTVYFIAYEVRRVVLVFKDACGMWWADKWKPLVGCIINLALNITLVQTIGIVGVIISTIVSYLFIEMPWETHVLFKIYFKKSEWGYYKDLLCYLAVITLGAALSWCICSLLPESGIVFFVLKGILCFFIANVLFFIAFHKKEEFEQVKNMVGGVIQRVKKR